MSIYRGRNRRDFYLSSLLYDSIDDNNLSAVKKLLCDKEADPNLVLPRKGISPFHLAVGCDSDGFAQEVTKLILQHGGNPNVRSDDGLTPVHIAGAWKRLDILRLLLSCGGDVDAQDANLMTPLHYAKKEDFDEGVNLMSLHSRSSYYDFNEEKEDCYKLVLDNIYIDNGVEIGKYEIVTEYKQGSIKKESLEKITNLPEADPNEIVLSWFNTHIDDVGGKTYVKMPVLSETASDSDVIFSFESSVDESDNDNQRLAKMFNITFRKLYRKKRKLSTESRTPPKCKSIKDSVSPEITNTPTEQSFYVSSKVKEYSSESGIVSLPNSREDLENNQNANNIFISMKNSPKNTHESLEEKLRGYNSCNNEKLGTISPADIIFPLVTKEQSGKLNSITRRASYNNNSMINKLQSSDSSEYLTCTFNSLMEKNIFSLGEVTNRDLSKSDETRSIRSLNAKSEGIGSTDLSFVSVSEVYRYEDCDQGIVLYERRLLKTPSECNGSVRTGSIRSAMSSLPDIVEYDAETLRRELTLLGFEPGPITKTTKGVYLKKLYQLKKKHPTWPMCDGKISTKSIEKVMYSVELQKTLRNPDWINDLAQYKSLEELVQKQFSNPDPTKKWREGVNKSSFTYLLLDPRKTNNLPGRAEVLTKQEIWETFLSAIFYIGKGKRSRPYSHLYEAVQLWNKSGCNPKNKKVQTILDIWKSDGGVICLHVFQNIIPVEAYTREAAMINALKLENITNARVGDFYGIAATWNERQKRMLGVYLLHKAMHIFLHEGERQLSPRDIDCKERAFP